jgi:predicted nucleic acid-binding protein
MNFCIDSNVLIDLADTQKVGGNEFVAWSVAVVEAALKDGRVEVCDLVFAEIVTGFSTTQDVVGFLEAIGLQGPHRTSVDALFQAGRAHKSYRLAGGTRERTLPDFIIGADALDRGATLITRDTARYATYFPTLQLIAPPL